MEKRIKIGIIGCGAVTEMFYLPAIKARSDIQLTAAVDRSASRAKLVGESLGAASFDSVAAAAPFIDAAIVALPHNLHASVVIELLEAGKHVLVEKPMALTIGECDAMLAAAGRGKATVTVGQMRRFSPAVAAAKALLDYGVVGRVKSFEILEGNVFSWPAASDYFLKKETSGGGVLIDTGAHTLDMVLWLFGDVASLDYRDDAFGGVEADCEIRMTMANGVAGRVELSRTRELPTELKIEGDRGKMVVAYKPNELTLEVGGRRLETFKMATEDPSGQSLSVWHYMIVKQLDNWIRSLQGMEPVLVPGEEGRKVVALIERCYAERKPLHFPWVNQATGRAVS